MGQRSAIIMFLASGGIVVPAVVLAIVAGSLGRSALPVAMLVQVVGFACLVFAKWSELAAGQLFSFGPKRLSARGRKYYWSGYALIGCGLVLAFASLAYPYGHAATRRSRGLPGCVASPPHRVAP